MSGPDLCPKCKGLHFRNAPCVVRKPAAGSSSGRTAPFEGVKTGSNPVPAPTPKRGPGRPKTITDMRAYKAEWQTKYRAEVAAGIRIPKRRDEK